MKSKHTKWFINGFGLTLIIAIAILAVSQVSTGLAVSENDFPPFGNLTPEQASQLASLQSEPQLQSDPPSNLNIPGEAEQADQAPVVNLASNAIEGGGLIGTPMIIPAADFRSDGFDPDSSFFSFAGGTVQGKSTGDGCMMAPAYLPDNVNITGFVALVIDNDDVVDFYITLMRINNSTGVTNSLANVDTIGLPSSPNLAFHYTTTISTPLVDYPNYAYYVATCLLSENIKMAGVQIYYTNP